MKDKKALRRKYLAQIEMERMLARYPYECKDLGTHQMTQEELEEEARLKKIQAYNPWKLSL